VKKRSQLTHHYQPMKTLTMKDKRDDSGNAKESLPANTTGKTRYNSYELFAGQQEILIEHAGHAYRLRITRQDKLILTK